MLIYLAAPYSHKDPDVKEQRIAQFCMVDSKLANQGFHTVSPLFKSLLFRYCKDVPSDWEFWKDHGDILMSKCDKLVVIKLDGWENSTGVQGEIELAEKYNIPVEYISLGDL